MKALSGWTISVGLVLAATAANAQGAPQSRPGYIATSDFTEPYADVPPPPRVIYGSPAPEYGYGYRQAPQGYNAPRDYGAPRGYGPPEYGPAPGYDVGLLPPREVFAILRETGFQPLGVPHLRGLFYHAAAVDRRGDEVRVVIDARNGRIVRFVPAYGYGEEGRAVPPRNAPYGYGPPPADQLSSGQPHPQANAPKMASRTPQAVPVPKSAPARSNDEKPVAVEKPATPPPQQSAAVQVKPAEAAPATAPAPEAKPAPVIQPTQEMPKVQGLE